MNTGGVKFLSRKWILTLVIQIPATIALFVTVRQAGPEGTETVIRILSTGDYAQICTANIAAYSLANAATYFTQMMKARAESEKASG